MFDVCVYFIQDLLKHTPSSHPDYPLLQDALRISQNFLSSINEESTPRRQSMTVKKGEVSAETPPSIHLTPLLTLIHPPCCLRQSVFVKNVFLKGKEMSKFQVACSCRCPEAI